MQFYSLPYKIFPNSPLNLTEVTVDGPNMVISFQLRVKCLQGKRRDACWHYAYFSFDPIFLFLGHERQLIKGTNCTVQSPPLPCMRWILQTCDLGVSQVSIQSHATSTEDRAKKILWNSNAVQSRVGFAICSMAFNFLPYQIKFQSFAFLKAKLSKYKK